MIDCLLNIIVFFNQHCLTGDWASLLDVSIWLMALLLDLLLKIKHSFISLLFHNFIRNDSYYIAVSRYVSFSVVIVTLLRTSENRFYHLYENCNHYSLTVLIIFFKLIYTYSSILTLFDGNFWGTMLASTLISIVGLHSFSIPFRGVYVFSVITTQYNTNQDR